VALAKLRPYRSLASVVSGVMNLQKIDVESSAEKNPRIIPKPHW